MKRRWQKSARVGFFPPFDFQTSLMQRSTNRVSCERRWPTHTTLGASLHAYFFMVMSTSGCCLAVFPGWGAQESHTVYRLSNGLQTHYQQCCVAAEPCRLHHISTVSATTPNSMVGECWGVCVLCMWVFACEKHNAERKVAALKAWLIWFYTVPHF